MEDRIINYNLLWEKLRDYSIKVGRLGTRPLLLLYLVLKSPQTSKEEVPSSLFTSTFLPVCQYLLPISPVPFPLV
jgi:hypothetical protein